MSLLRKIMAGVAILSLSLLTGCGISIQEKFDKYTNTYVRTVGIAGCGNPSQRITIVIFKDPKTGELLTRDKIKSAGPDLCNTAVGSAAGTVVIAATGGGGSPVNLANYVNAASGSSSSSSSSSSSTSK